MRNGFEWLRIVTPVLVTINLFLMGQLYFQMNDLNQRIFHHVTDTDIHVAKQEIAQLRIAVLESQRELQRQIVETLKNSRLN